MAAYLGRNLIGLIALSGQKGTLMTTRRQFGWVVLALASASLAAAQPATAGKKPDFAVKSVSFLGDAPHYIVRDRTGGGLIVNVKIKNEGKSAADGAGKLIVMGNGLLRPTKFVFDVPKLRPGGSETIDFDVEGSDLDGITSYTSKACASAGKGDDNRNDCRGGPAFAVIPRTWVGSTNATWTDGLVIQSLVANNATFTFDPGRTTNEAFAYLATGSLTATITGDEDPDCTYSGTGDTAITAIDPARASLFIDTDLLTYRAVGIIPTSVTYTAHATCDGNPPVPFEQEFGTWLTTAIEIRDAADEVLTGTATTSGPDRWSWNLRAE